MSNSDKGDDWTWLANWYQRQCDGDWEHEYGITISTLDNPGWSLEIDLAGTALDGYETQGVFEEGAPDDWYSYRVSDAKFQGASDPSKLMILIAAFRRLVDES